MSRVEEMERGLKSANANGGMNNQQWITYMLTDIALSLARIVDVLEKEKKEEGGE